MLMQMHKPRLKGFTLIEILMVVAIIGILAAIAFPSYQNSIRKSKRQVAISDMLAYKQAQERYRTNNLTYGDMNIFDCTNPANATYCVNKSSKDTDYTFAISNNTATTYTITATAVGTQAGGSETGCTPLTLDQADNRGPQALCWAR